MLISLTGNVFAIDSNKEIIPSESVILKTKASEIPVAVKNVLIEKGANITDDTTIEVVKINGTEDTAICITNDNAAMTESKIFISYKENTVKKLVVDNSLGDALRGFESNETTSISPYSFLNGVYVVSATASRMKYSGNYRYYYRPYSCSFSYTNNGGTTPSRIIASFVTTGNKVLLPNYTEYTDIIEHTVSSNVSSPVANTPYYAYKYPAENVLFDIDTGSPMHGQSIIITLTVNGTTYPSMTIPVTFSV